MKRNHGYSRKSSVPVADGTSVKVCSHCRRWFAARRYERVCDGCVPAFVRARRAAQAHHTRGTQTLGKRAGQRHPRERVRSVYSETLNLTFRCPESDPRAASLDCRVAAYELAATQRHGRDTTICMNPCDYQ